MSDFDNALQVVIDGLTEIKKTSSNPPRAMLGSLQTLIAAVLSQPAPAAIAETPSVASVAKKPTPAEGTPRIVFVMETHVSDPDVEAKVTELRGKIIGAMRLPEESFQVISFPSDQDGAALASQVAELNPEAVVAMGSAALKTMMGLTGPLKALRGNWQDLNGIPVMATYHPAYLVRNQAMSEKRKLWEDLLQVMERLKLPISEKQRGFFTQK